MSAAADAWLVLAAGAAGTYLWRGLGVALSARIDPNGAVFQWVSCVSYAMLAGLVARMTILPIGVLAETALLDRLCATVLAFAVFFVLGRHVLGAVTIGVTALVLLQLV